MKEIDDILKVANAATPGPWSLGGMDSGHSRYSMDFWIDQPDNGDTICSMESLLRADNSHTSSDDGLADAAFIISARENVPKMAETLKSLISYADELERLPFNPTYASVARSIRSLIKVGMK